MGMNRRQFLRGAAALSALAALPGTAGRATLKGRPNIVWIAMEDMGPHLGCYGAQGARTPRMDQLAAEGIRFEHAFSVSPVCSASRSCLITGQYPTTLGTHHHRSRITLPQDIECFPAYLRGEGYYCTNHVKTDYNFPTPSGTWDENGPNAHWRNRPREDQPFFACISPMGSHESLNGMLREGIKAAPHLEAYAEWLEMDPPHDPNTLPLPPYFPDTEMVRKCWAHYFDVITATDRHVGAILDELDEDGLAENTIVVCFGDHGMGLPRGKRFLYDAGLRVPLIVRWPAGLGAGEVEERLVSFVDFAPTMLRLAGVEPPPHMQGRPFLASDAPPRAYVYAARDRMDEQYDTSRAVRDLRYKYIRHFEPWKSLAQPQAYQDSWPLMREWRRLAGTGALEGPPAALFAPEKPAEELFDLDADPHEIRNLAADPAHRETLERMRHALESWMEETGDLVLMPEPLLEASSLSDVEKQGQPAYGRPGDAEAAKRIYGRTVADWVTQLNLPGPRQKRLLAIHAVGLAGLAAIPVLRDALADHDPAVVYWASLAIGRIAAEEPAFVPEAEKLLAPLRDSGEVVVRLGAAAGLTEAGLGEQAAGAALAAMDSPFESVRLHAAHILAGIGGGIEPVRQALERAAGSKTWTVAQVAQRALAAENGAD